MEPLCKCGEIAKHEVVTGWTGPFNMFPITEHYCTACYAKYLANKSVDEVIEQHTS